MLTTVLSRGREPWSIVVLLKNLHSNPGRTDKIGDLSKEIDARIKDRVAEYRNKEEYELGDLTLALDEMAKEEVKKLTGKEECTLGPYWWRRCQPHVSSLPVAH